MSCTGHMNCRGFAHSAGISSLHQIISSMEKAWFSTSGFSCQERYVVPLLVLNDFCTDIYSKTSKG